MCENHAKYVILSNTVRDVALHLQSREPIALTHYSPVLLIYIPWKHQKTFRFPDVFRRYRKVTRDCNGLTISTGLSI